MRLTKLVLAAALLSTTLATAARADGPNTTKPGTVAAQDAASAAPLDRFAWAGIGYYGAHYSGVTVCDDGVCESGGGGTDGAFGIQVGGALAFAQLAPGLKLDGWASIAPVFGSGTYFPINLGAGVTYDQLPVKFFGGLAFSVVPNSGTTAVGLDINLMAIYPLPQLAKNLGVMGQLQFDILNENLFIWNQVVGGTYSF